MLAQASVSGSPSFPIIVLDDEAAISVEAVAPLAARLGHGLTGADSIYGLLQDWPRNFGALQAVVAALDDAQLGKYTRSAFTALEFFELGAPIPAPRQVFRAEAEFACVPASTIAGPRAKVPMPPGQSSLSAGLALGIVVGAPTYRASAAEAALSVAGFVACSQYRDGGGAMLAPAFLPTGPYFVPAPFCPEMQGRISFNGETAIDSALGQAAAVEALRQVSAQCHLFPGDLVTLPMGRPGDIPLGEGDIIEAAISGLGQQTTNIMLESSHADSRD